jgi:type VI secretion system protein ImpG
MRAIAPYFGPSAPNVGSTPDYYHVVRRECSEASNVDGGEFYVSFLDSQFDLTRLLDEVVGGVALCTNRRLPEQLRRGSALQLEGAGPDYPITTFSKPTRHYMPDQIGQRPWALVSQMALNHLSLNSSADGLLALKEILSLHVGPERQRGRRQIGGIKSLTSSPVMRLPRAARSHGFIRGTRIHVELDRADFPDASPVLFWCVLRHFFALYIQFNNVVENSFVTQDGAGDDRDWEALDGMQWIL